MENKNIDKDLKELENMLEEFDKKSEIEKFQISKEEEKEIEALKIKTSKENNDMNLDDLFLNEETIELDGQPTLDSKPEIKEEIKEVDKPILDSKPEIKEEIKEVDKPTLDSKPEIKEVDKPTLDSKPEIKEEIDLEEILMADRKIYLEFNINETFSLIRTIYSTDNEPEMYMKMKKEGEIQPLKPKFFKELLKEYNVTKYKEVYLMKIKEKNIEIKIPNGKVENIECCY